MLTVCLLLGIWLVFALIAIIMFGIEDSFNIKEWLTVMLFVFCFPAWVAGWLVTAIKQRIELKRVRQRRRELGYDDED